MTQQVPAQTPQAYNLVADLKHTFGLPPGATLALCGVALVGYLVSLSLGHEAIQHGFGIPVGSLQDLATGRNHHPLQLVPTWLTPLTYSIFHIELWHLIPNVFGLWILGRFAEPMLGRSNLVLTYFVFAYVTALSIIVIAPERVAPIVGASGGISGILGCYWGLRFRDMRAWWLRSIEWGVLGGLLAIIFYRTVPPSPDIISSLLWHGLPFVLAWFLGRYGPLHVRGDRAVPRAA